MKIIECTLRDGGYQKNFSWGVPFARRYFNFCKAQDEIAYVELGYWKQGGATFFNLNEEIVKSITNGQSTKVAVMIDYEHCQKDLKEYESDSYELIRMTCLPSSLKDACQFLDRLKAHTGKKTALNLIHVEDNSPEAFEGISTQINKYDSFDIVCIADSYGSMNLSSDIYYFDFLKTLKSNTGAHLHAHSGLEVLNYYECKKNNVDYIDTTMGGIGKGAGNLPLEIVLGNYFGVLNFIEEEPDLVSKYDPFMFMVGKEKRRTNWCELYKGMSLCEFYAKVKQ